MTGWLRVDFHSHTDASKDSLTRPADLVRACRAGGLNRIVVTDHNAIHGALAAREIDPELVIVGEEIMTTEGEILAAFVKEEITPGLTPEETIRRLREQGAFISISHPFDRLRSGGWKEARLRELVPLVDAIEVFNARCMWPGANRRAREFARAHGLPGTVGSDAHAAFELGRSALRLPGFADADGLRAVIRQGVPEMRPAPHGAHLASRYASLTKR